MTILYTPHNLIFVGDEMVFRYEIRDARGQVVDVSGATEKKLKFKLPSGTVKTFNLDFTNNGKDGFVEYRTLAADLSEAGEWIAHVYIKGVGIFTGHSTFDVFRVFSPLS